MLSESQRAFSELRRLGLLLQTDKNLPNLCELVAGEKVSGSWWAHPRGREIFRVGAELADHRDVLLVKPISSKITYLHRKLWPFVIALGQARESWQMDELSQGARQLLAEIDRKPREPGRGMGKAASELETNLLVY